MRESRSKEIDGFEFTVQQLPAMRATKLLMRLAKALAPALGPIAGAGNIAKLDVSLVANAAAQVFERFSESDLEALIKEVFEGATVKSNDQTFPVMAAFNETFAGKVGTILKAVQFALEVNYTDFLGGLLAYASEPKVKAKASELKAP